MIIANQARSASLNKCGEGKSREVFKRYKILLRRDRPPKRRAA